MKLLSRLEIQTITRIAIACMLCVAFWGCKKSKCDNGIQDGDETGVDCGGKCDPCPPYPAELIGLWEQCYSLEIWRYTNFSSTSAVNNAFLRFNRGGSPCTKVDFQDINSNGDIYYLEGSPYDCLYPEEDYWRYDQAGDSILALGTASKVLKLDQDSLILKKRRDVGSPIEVGSYYYLSKNGNAYASMPPYLTVDVTIQAPGVPDSLIGVLVDYTDTAFVIGGALTFTHSLGLPTCCAWIQNTVSARFVSNYDRYYSDLLVQYPTTMTFTVKDQNNKVLFATGTLEQVLYPPYQGQGASNHFGFGITCTW